MGRYRDPSGGIDQPQSPTEQLPTADGAESRGGNDAASEFRLLGSVLEAMGHPVVVFDRENRLLHYNDCSAKLFGIMSSDRSVNDLLSRNRVFSGEGSQMPLEAAAVDAALRREGDTSVKVSIAEPEQARPNRFSLTIHPLHACDGTRAGAVAVFQPLGISDAKDEAVLIQARDAGLEASRLRAEFAANMSHEIRTPLNAIIGMTDLLLGSELGSEQREYAETVVASAQSLLGIVEDVLDFSRISAGEMRLGRVTFEPAQAIEAVAQAFSEMAADKGIELAVHIDPNVPKRLVGDPERLEQVLTNLIENAVKFTARGRIEIRVNEESHTPEESVVQFVVRDTGIGIPPEAQSTLFRVFSKGDSSMTRKHGGMGIGLALSARIVEAMGGSIGVESKPGEGSSFWFTAALGTGARDDTNDAPPRPRRRAASRTHAAPQSSAPEPRRSTVRILMAEDNAVNQRVMLTMLRKLGYEAETASNGLEALTAISRQPYDIVLMDCQMPELDGYEATRRIRQQGGRFTRIPIIGVTAHALQGDREKCLGAGMDEYLSKPILLQDLTATLERWLAPAGFDRAAIASVANGSPEQAEAALPRPHPEAAAQAVEDKEVEAIDEDALRLLEEVEKEGAGQGFVANLIGLFLTDMGERTRMMEDAVKKADWDAASHMAHAIKGSSGNFGARRLTELCVRMEAAARSRHRKEAAEVLGELLNECGRVKAALEPYRSKVGA